MKRIHLSSCAYLGKYVTYLPGRAADYLFKPNGLWYAMDDQWQAWCDEHSAGKFGNYRYGYELDVDISKVCVLDDVEPVMAFHWKYGYKHEGNVKAIDWQKVMIDYSGIEVQNYDELNLACSFRSVIWLRNWAVNGGCIWDLNAVAWNAMDERKVGLMNEKVRRQDTAIDD